MVKKYVRLHKRRKPKGGFSVVKGHYRNVSGKIKGTIPTKVDDEIIDLMIENNVIGEGITRGKREWAGLTGEITELERGFGKGTPLAKRPKRERDRVFKELKTLQSEQKQVRKRITTLYEPLPQPQKSRVITNFNRRFKEFNPNQPRGRFFRSLAEAKLD